MRYGFTPPGRGPLATPDTLAAIARRGEELGYHLLLFGDHIVVPRRIASPYPYTATGEFPGSGSGEALEQLTVLAFLAGQTRTIRLVTSVTIVPHRNPLVAAKALATLDVLSKGRLTVGVGVGPKTAPAHLGWGGEPSSAAPHGRAGQRLVSHRLEPPVPPGGARAVSGRTATAGRLRQKGGQGPG